MAITPGGAMEHATRWRTDRPVTVTVTLRAVLGVRYTVPPVGDLDHTISIKR